MDIVIAGSHGLIGTALTTGLRDRGHRVRRLVRRDAQGPDELRWDPRAGTLDPRGLRGVDAVVNLAGASIGDWPLTAARKREIVASRTRSTTLLSEAVAALDAPPAVLLQASGIGAYGDRGDTLIDESEPLGHTFFAGVVRQWEASTAAAEAAGVRVAHLRTGIVLSPEGGALGRLLPLLRLGLGGPLGTGRQYWSWITLPDEVAAIIHLLDAPVRGPVNLVASATTNADLTRAIAVRMGRPAVLRPPAWALRLVLGDLSQEVLGSVRATPAKLAASGFVPRHPDVEAAARYVTGAG
ncbi:TIGR01777 family oxidoreductase [Cellulomonas chengniuliangii]|uniref:TIGR01777 family oxidoreductase n=1 Tax=Cellulomonas chengniuliangii TaxID=2968084 RepID=A0ABY5L410_9CELL|nr:TIGR01777 family oxidoreductase [Cellulomonas chengniuliangii]MCC2308145.1 TIGR01777 family oxidoreductase [Cellulomonas chengniuliangii]UUI76539.1 TIGR01777 family oxidoreductase [Cellulomonas chengniuliangii]